MNYTPEHSTGNPGPNFSIPPHWDLSSVPKSYLDDIVNSAREAIITSQSHDHISYKTLSLVEGEINSFDLIFNQSGHLVADRSRFGDSVAYINVAAGDVKNGLSVNKNTGRVEITFSGAPTLYDFSQAGYGRSGKISLMKLWGGNINYSSRSGVRLTRPVTFDFNTDEVLSGEDIVDALIRFDMGANGWEIRSHGKSAEFKWMTGDIDVRVDYQVQDGRIITSMLDKKTGIAKTLDCPIEVDVERVTETAFVDNNIEPEQILYPRWRTEIGHVTCVNFRISKELKQEDQSE